MDRENKIADDAIIKTLNDLIKLFNGEELLYTDFKEYVIDNYFTIDENNVIK